MIDSPDHEHLDELLQILLTFQKWKKDIKDPKAYIPWQSDEDLCWLIFSIVGISKTYLKADKSRVLVQIKI